MKQYLDLLQRIKEEGTYKPAAREGMPGAQSLFGHQFRHDLRDGFPLLTTKKMYWKGVVAELLWFLRGDTNIKYLIDNQVNIWNEDSYNYYLKIASKNAGPEANGIYFNNGDGTLRMFLFDEFIAQIKNGNMGVYGKYTLGDCGFQYGRVWRKWEVEDYTHVKEYPGELPLSPGKSEMKIIDQIGNLIKQLRESPESRRHIVTAIDPGHEKDLALYWCHALFQFNCRPLTLDERFDCWFYNHKPNRDVVDNYDEMGDQLAFLDERGVPKYYLDCQLYQRSCDAGLGAGFNIASYSLLTHIIAKLCNMIPAHFIHSFGDVHIYDNHRESIDEQLKRIPGKLPTLRFGTWIDMVIKDGRDLDWILNEGEEDLYKQFIIENYNPHPSIKMKLSTGLKE